jgi:hypothetical protein
MNTIYSCYSISMSGFNKKSLSDAEVRGREAGDGRRAKKGHLPLA